MLWIEQMVCNQKMSFIAIRDAACLKICIKDFRFRRCDTCTLQLNDENANVYNKQNSLELILTK